MLGYHLSAYACKWDTSVKYVSGAIEDSGSLSRKSLQELSPHKIVANNAI
jgi:hypothetical protein